jgi:phenylpyruvate tautomerase PptA (4-oxalocrotonate tautomerase family)
MQATEALQAIALHNSGNSIRKEQVADMLAQVRGTTFASIVQVTKVALAAKHKAITIKKVTEASVQLFNNISEHTSVWANAVKRSASKLTGNDAEAVAGFEAQSNWFEHTDCYSVVKHKTQDKYYLYAIYNSGNAVYMMDGNELSKDEVAQYMTPAAARDLLDTDNRTVNVTHDIEHSAVCRATSLENIVSIVAQKQLLIM